MKMKAVSLYMSWQYAKCMREAVYRAGVEEQVGPQAWVKKEEADAREGADVEFTNLHPNTSEKT